MRMLIAVDGSKSALEAVRLAGKLIDPAADLVALYYSPRDLEQRVPQASRSIIGGAAAAVFDDGRGALPADVAARAEFIQSDVAAAMGILAAAATWQADMVVVGARGHGGGIQGLLLGSVSRAVVHGSDRPVLVVRTAVPADRGLKVLACHHPASAASVAKTLGRLQWPSGTEGVAIGVAESLLAGPLPGWLEKRVRDPETAAVAQAWQREHDDEVAALGGALDAFIATLPPPFRSAKPIVAQGNPGDTIIATARDRGIDLIVLGRTPTDPLSRWLIGSTSEAVLGRAQASVLMVPVE